MSDKLTYKVWVEISVERCDVDSDQYDTVTKWEPMCIGTDMTRPQATKTAQEFCDEVVNYYDVLGDKAPIPNPIIEERL